MTRRASPGVRLYFIAATAVLLIAAGVLATRRLATPAPQISTGSAVSAPAAPSPADASRAAPVADTAGKAPSLTPAAEWLALPPDPIRVSVAPPSGPGEERRVSPAGAVLGTMLPDGTRVRLEIPPDALLRSVTLSIAPVTVSGVPAAAGILGAVRIAPDDLPLLKPAVLAFDTRQPVPDGITLTGIAIHRDELHLFPSLRPMDPRLRGRAHVVLPLARLGTYGIANGTAAEISAIAAHSPGDYFARLEQHAALSFPALGPSTTSRDWQFIPVVHAQSPTPEWVDGLFRAITEFFNQVVVQQFTHIPPEDCSSGVAFNAIRTYYEWRTLPDLLFHETGPPGSPAGGLEKDRVAALEARGYSAEQIAAIDQAMSRYREGELRELIARAQPLLAAAYKTIFTTSHRCCVESTPLDEYLRNMQTAWREAELQEIRVDDDPLGRTMECACRLEGQRLGSADLFTGSITHSETYSAERTQQLGGSRTTKESIQFEYQQDMFIESPYAKGSFLASFDATAQLEQRSELRDARSCGDVVGTTHFVGTGWHDNGEFRIEVRRVPGTAGTYRISYSPRGVEGFGTSERTWSAGNCQIFNNHSKDRDFTRNTVVGSPGEVIIEAAVDPSNPNRLSGSRDLEVPGIRQFATPLRPHVSWDLQRCSAK